MLDDKLRNLNSKKFERFLIALSLLQKKSEYSSRLQSYSNENFRLKESREYNSLEKRNDYIKKVIDEKSILNIDILEITKFVHKIELPWKEIVITILLLFISLVIFSIVKYYNLPRVYKISKETLLYNDSSCTKPNSDTLISNVDIFSSQSDGEFIKSGLNSVKPQGYINWLTGKSSNYYYKNDYEFRDDTNGFFNFRELYEKTTDYELLTAVDKIGILKLLDTLGTNYSLSANSNKPSISLRNILFDSCDSKSRNLFLILKKSGSVVKSGYYLIITTKNPNQIKYYEFRDTNTNDILDLPIEWIKKDPLDIKLYDSGGNAILYKVNGSTCSFKPYP